MHCIYINYLDELFKKFVLIICLFFSFLLWKETFLKFKNQNRHKWILSKSVKTHFFPLPRDLHLLQEKKKKRFIVIMMKGKLTNWYIGKKKLFDKGQKEIAILSKILSNVLILLELYFMYIFMKCHQSIFSSQLVTAMSVKLLV